MKIICPTLNRQEIATPENIAEIVSLLENINDPFLILEQDEMTYIQTLWTPEGYNLEYQEGSVLNHYMLEDLTHKEKIIWVLQSYLNGDSNWKKQFNFVKKDITSLSYKVGHKIGYLIGKLSNMLQGK